MTALAAKMTNVVYVRENKTKGIVHLTLTSFRITRTWETHKWKIEHRRKDRSLLCGKRVVLPDT